MVSAPVFEVKASFETGNKHPVPGGTCSCTDSTNRGCLSQDHCPADPADSHRLRRRGANLSQAAEGGDFHLSQINQ